MDKKRNVASVLHGIPGVTYIFLIVFAAASFGVPRFFSVGNLSTMLLQACTLTLLSVAMALSLMMGSIDLSIGGVVSMSGVIMAYCMRGGMRASFALLIGLAIGAIFGLFNGLMVIPNLLALLALSGAVARSMKKSEEDELRARAARDIKKGL